MLTPFIEESKWQRAEEKLKERNKTDMLVELHYLTGDDDDLMHYWAFALINSKRVSMQVPKQIPPISKAIIDYLTKKIKK